MVGLSSPPKVIAVGVGGESLYRHLGENCLIPLPKNYGLVGWVRRFLRD